MAERNDVHVLIGIKHYKWIHNSSDDSWYTENFTQEGFSENRVSFHYPDLETWLFQATKRYEAKKSKYNPFLGKNFAFVFHDKETVGLPNERVSANIMEYARSVFKSNRDFTVTMYDWNLEELPLDKLEQIFSIIHQSFTTHSFNDLTNKAQPQTLVAKTKPKNNASESIIKLTESQLRRIIRETLLKALYD